MLKLMVVVGTRPQIIKSAPIVHEAEKHRDVELQLVHTGQHYDYELSKIFFDENDLPPPELIWRLVPVHMRIRLLR